jgi:2',3'-cyclic-nucleotide 2'-phosphodiesterase (5'-nucleotidase family)
MSGTLAATSKFTFTHNAEAGSAALGAEVVAFDAARNLILTLGASGIDILDATTGALRLTLPRADVTSGGVPAVLGTANSVAVFGNTLAVAYEGPTRTDNGAVVFYELGGTNAAPTAAQTRFIQPTAVPGEPNTLAQPDMVTFTPDGTRLLVAIEGEPADNYASDPLGGIGIIDVATGALTIAGFDAFDAATLKAAGVRITGRASEAAEAGTATAAADLEPEYIAVSADGTRAFVTLQDNNALAIVDIASATVTHVLPFGTKDHSLPGNGLDPNDRNGGTRIDTWPLNGLYQPDAVATFTANGRTYVVTANEGDAREWGNFVDAIRIADATLDPTAFPTAVANILKSNANTGRLDVSRYSSDTDGDGDLDRLDVFGARSFSIWEVTPGNTLVQVFDSGQMIDEIIAAVAPDPAALEGRDDNKGAEPEGLTLGTVDGQLYAFVALERANATMAFAIDTSGAAPTASYAGLIKTPGDVAPEVVSFIGGANPRLVVANEGSNTTTVYDIAPATPGTYTLQILHASDFEAGLAASTNAPRFAAIVDHLEDLVPNSITLSSGDNFIPGPFLSAGGDSAVRSALQDFYRQLLGDPTLDLSGLREGAARIDIAMLNAIGIQASVFGNHEFDLGTSAIADAIDMIAAGAGAGGVAPQEEARISNIGAQFPYLSANLDFTGANPLGLAGSATGDPALRALFTSTLRDAATYATTQADLASNQAVTNEALDSQIAPWTTINEGGETIGVLGITTQILAQISSPGATRLLDPAGDGGVDNVAELAAILQPYVDRMTALGINKIILLSHLQQNSLEQALAPLLSGVDIIIAGGSHAIFADDTDTLRPGDTAANTYPITLAGADGRPVMIVNTSGEYSYVGRLVATFDANGVLVADPDAAGPLGTGAVDPAISGAYAATDAVVQSLWGTTDEAVYFADGTRGGEVKQLADAVQGVINAKDGNVFGRTEVFLDGRRAEVRTEETNFGNLSADANLAAARAVVPTVSVSLKNGGGIRAEIGVVSGQPISVERPPIANPAAGKPEGGISQLDIENALRFNNGLSVATFTAANLAAVIENALRGATPGATPGAFPQVGGISFSFDGTRPAGDRVLTLAVLNDDGSVRDVLVNNGDLVGNPDRSFDVVMLNFLLDGGDGYMAGVTFTNRQDLFTGSGFAAEGREQKAFADFIASRHGTEATAFNQIDTPAALDTRVQNLAARADDVLPDITRVSGGVIDTFVAPLHAGGLAAVFEAIGTAGSDILVATASADAIAGGAGSDLLLPGRGNDIIDGGEGWDSVRFVGNRNEYQVLLNGSTVTVEGPEGSNTLNNVERLEFADRFVDLLGPSGWQHVFAVTNNSNPVAAPFALGTAYTGPVPGIESELVFITPDNVSVSAPGANVFIRTGSGDDAIVTGGGTNVVDASTGNNWLVSNGMDSFLIGDRDGGTGWDTILNFAAGDALTLFGFDDASAFFWAEGGAGGNTGATLHAVIGGGTTINASVTFAGVSLAEAQGYGVERSTVGGTPFLQITHA